MSGPTFELAREMSVEVVKEKLADRVRYERQRLGLSQAEFALRCGVPLRSYKRFELKDSDSLLIFLQIVAGFDRIVGLEMLFPAEPLKTDVRTATGILDRLMQKRDADKKTIDSSRG